MFLARQCYTLNMYFRAFTFTACLLLCGSIMSPRAARAADTAPTLSEVRQLEKQVDEKRQRELQSLERGLADQAIDPDSAVMTRARIEREYRNDAETIARKREEAERALDAKVYGKPASQSGAGASRGSGVSIPTTQIRTYGEPSPQEVPSREGRQDNVGLGVRELEF